MSQKTVSWTNCKDISGKAKNKKKLAMSSFKKA